MLGCRMFSTGRRGGSLGVLLLSALLCRGVSGIQFDVNPSSTRCISDDFSPEEESNIKLRSVGKAQSNIRAYVQDPEGRTLFDSTLSAQMQDVALPEEQYGMYRICVKNSDREIQRVEVMLTEKTAIAPGGKGDAPMKDHLRPLQQLFQRAEFTVYGISKELDNVRHREDSLRNTSDITNSRIQWFSIFSIFVLLAVSVWQIVYLRSFFRSKKLL